MHSRSRPSRHSSEQQREVDRINKSNEHHEILGVATTATASQITKAYKKLALKIHPDKNKSLGAEEAFKKLVNAKDTLSNPIKRYGYNLSRANARNPPKAGTFNSTSNNTSNSTSNRTQTNNSSQSRQRERGQGPPREQTHHNANNNPHYWYLLAVAVVVLGTAISLVPSKTKFTSKGSDPLYSLKANPRFDFVRRTLHLKVRYYVEKNFARRFRGSSLDKLEQAVEKEYFEDLERACAEQKSNLFIRQMYMKIRSWILSEEFEEIRMPACNKLENFQTNIFKS